MRLVHALVSCVIAAAAAGSALGADVVLKDGQSIATAKPYAVKGKMAILTRTDGSLVSIPVADIDLEKTAAAAKVVPAAPVAEAPPAPKKPATPAEAAKARPGKRASVVLTDADVRSSTAAPDGEKADKPGGGEVTMGPTSETRTKTGYSISGSVVNSGKGDVSGVAVTIEAVGEENRTLQSTFGRLAKDKLAPGEKATFTAEVETETDAKRFRYVPSQQISVPVKPADGTAAAAAAPSGGSLSKPPPPPKEINPVAGDSPKAARSEPSPEPTPQIVPRPDIAPPAANAPVGAPTAPGGVYVPRPADNQAGPNKTP